MELATLDKPTTKEHPLRQYIKDVPDFPKPGIMFRDISPLLRWHFGEAIAAMADMFSQAEWARIDVVAGIESRGFILAAGLAALQGKGFVKMRKRGKLPGPVVMREYGLEYGQDALEMQPGSGRILIVDDVLATGGTLAAAADLAQESGHDVRGFCCLVNLAYLNQFTWHRQTARSLIHYDH